MFVKIVRYVFGTLAFPRRKFVLRLPDNRNQSIAHTLFLSQQIANNCFHSALQRLHPQRWQTSHPYSPPSKGWHVCVLWGQAHSPRHDSVPMTSGSIYRQPPYCSVCKREDLGNCRPLRQTSISRKVMEKIILTETMQHVWDNWSGPARLHVH